LNQRRHGIEFETAAAVFSDPLSITIYDSGHSEIGERWITIGAMEPDAMVVVSHTFRELNPTVMQVRIISARNATRRERWQYENGQFSVHEETPMEDEYDFSRGERGRFYSRGAVFEMPIYLKPQVLAFFSARAKEERIGVGDLLNRVLEKDIE